MLPIVKTFLINWLVSSGNLDVRYRPVPSSPGLYYQHASEARQFNDEMENSNLTYRPVTMEA
jgi:hypothetical protein